MKTEISVKIRTAIENANLESLRRMATEARWQRDAESNKRHATARDRADAIEEFETAALVEIEHEADEGEQSSSAVQRLIDINPSIEPLRGLLVAVVRQRNELANAADVDALDEKLIKAGG